MKNTIFFISIMLFIFVENANSQTNINSNKKQTKTIKAINKNTIHLVSISDLSIPNLPLGFQGVNPIELYKNLEKRKDKLNKKEFETTSQFQDRIKKENTKPIIGKLTEDSLYFFKVLLSTFTRRALSHRLASSVAVVPLIAISKIPAASTCFIALPS